MADHTNYFQHPAGIDVEDESALAAAERAEVAADSAEASATSAAASATESNTWKDLSKAWAIQLVTQVDEGAGPVDYSSKHYATVVAAGHATDAGNSAAAAAATLIAFEQAYLGTKLSDPALDNEGQALIEGAVYWNSTNKILRLYNGTSWQDWDPVQLIISDWALATNYTVGTAVIGSDGILYVADSTHISSSVDFATDLNAGLWRDVHPAGGAGGFQTVTQFSPDGTVWYDRYQAGWTWARTREVSLVNANWPTQLSEIQAPQQPGGWDGYTGSSSSTTVSDDFKTATTINTGLVHTYGSEIVGPGRKVYLECTFVAGTVDGGEANNPGILITPAMSLSEGSLYVGMTSGAGWKVRGPGSASSPTTNTLVASDATTPVNGAVIGIALDPAGKKGWVSLDGTWLGTGTQDPYLGIGGFVLDDNFQRSGFQVKYVAGNAATNCGWTIADALNYLPPIGFHPWGNPTLSGFLEVNSDDDRWRDTPFLMTFDGFNNVQDPEEDIRDNTSIAWVSADYNKRVPWPYVNPGAGNLSEGTVREPAPSGSCLDTAETSHTLYYPGHDLGIPGNEDFTLECVVHASQFNGNRTWNLFEIGPTGQKNNPFAASYGTWTFSVDTGAPAATTGPVLNATAPGVSATPSALLSPQAVGSTTAEEWMHLIWERIGDTLYSVVDGVQVGSVSVGTDSRVGMDLGFLGPSSGYTNANLGANAIGMLNGLYNSIGHNQFIGLVDQIRLTRRGARYGLNNWPTAKPNAKWPGATVATIDEDDWKVYRIGQEATGSSISVEFSNGNGDWHSGYEAGDTLGRIVSGTDESTSSATLVWDVSVDTSMQVDADGDLAFLVTGADFRNGYSQDFFSGDKIYFELEFQCMEQQGTEQVGMIGANRKIVDQSPDVTVYGGFTLNTDGTVTGAKTGSKGAGFSQGTNIGFAVDVSAKKYWHRINGMWQNPSLDYDDAHNMDVDFDSVNTGLTIFAANYQSIPADNVAGDKWVFIPESPRYSVPSGFRVVGKVSANQSVSQKTVLGTFPVGAAEAGTRIEFSADGATWSEDYTEGDSFARIPRNATGLDAETYFSAKDSVWNGGITDGARSSAGGFLFTTDGEHSTGKHYWEVAFSGDPAFPGSEGTNVVPYPYWDGQVAWEGDTFGACLGLAGPQIAGVSDPNTIKSGGRYYTVDTAPYTIASRDTYFFMNKKDRYAKNGSLVDGYGMQYEGPDRIGSTNYAGMKWGETWGLAADFDNNLYWIIDGTGTVIPSGDPASGTGGFAIPSGQAYRFLVDFRAASNQGGLVSIKGISQHGVPSGFTFYNTNPGGADPIIAADATLYCSFETDDQDESANSWTMTAVTAAQSGAATLGVGGGGLDMGTTAGQRLSYLKTPTNVAFDIGASDKLVFKCKFKGVGTAGRAFQWLFGSDNGLPSTAGFGIQVAESSGAMYVFYNGTMIFNGVTEGAFTDEREVLIERNSVGLFRMYVNGVYKTQASNTTAATCNAFYVGSAGGTFPGDNGDWNGYIDDLFFATDTTVQCPFALNDNNGYTVDPIPMLYNQPIEASLYKEWRMGGAVHHFGSAAPATSLGKVGDIFTDTTGKTVYEKTAAATWTSRYTYT